MSYFLLFLFTLLGLIVGYLCGSISWAVIITRAFYHIDIYKVGSGNAGGTNVGRAVGKKGALTVIILDILKCLIPLWVVFLVVEYTPLTAFIESYGTVFSADVYSMIYYATALGAGIGHVFPLYYHFKGGKAVSCFGGFVLGTSWLLASFGLATFLLVFAFRKRVSLSSIIGTCLTLVLTALFATLNYFNPSWLSFAYFFIPGPKMLGGFAYLGTTVLMGLMVLLLHRPNMVRLAKHVEPETHFLQKGEKPVQAYDEKK